MSSTATSIHGIADMVVESELEVYPIEFKLTGSKQKKGDLLQLVAYGLLCEEYFNKKCYTGFITDHDKILHQITFDDKIKEDVLEKIEQIQKMMQKGLKPDSSASWAQCANCEYLKHCNDRE